MLLLLKPLVILHPTKWRLWWIFFLVAHGKVVDASQEMAAVGMCNIIGSFFSSFPVNASFSRAAVSNASGIKSPLGGIYTSEKVSYVKWFAHSVNFAATMVILALTFLTPYFSFIPKATLAAVIVCAVLFMVEVAITKMIWNVHSEYWNTKNCSENVSDHHLQSWIWYHLRWRSFLVLFLESKWEFSLEL